MAPKRMKKQALLNGVVYTWQREPARGNADLFVPEDAFRGWNLVSPTGVVRARLRHPYAAGLRSGGMPEWTATLVANSGHEYTHTGRWFSSEGDTQGAAEAAEAIVRMAAQLLAD